MNRDTIYLAALLHDIGKFGQRADAFKLDIDVDLTPIFQLANYYASGMEGSKEVEQKAISTRLTSIFDGIKRNSVRNQLLPLNQLSLTKEAMFPVAGLTASVASEIDTLWKSLEAEVDKLHRNLKEISHRNYAETLLHLLHKYACHIPFGAKHLPDVSLYDHLKMKAAFAVCIYDYCQKYDLEASPQSITDEGQPCILIGGDMSGIQKYIYDIISTDASKNLKGRSFYLQMLSDNVVTYLLNELGLLSGHVVYSSGGGFYILAPNTEAIKTKLKEAKKHLSNVLFDAHQTALYLSIEYAEVSQGQIFKQEINEVWGELMRKISEQKSHRYAEQLVTNFDTFFEASDIGGLQKRDVITGEEFAEKERKVFLDEEKEKPVKITTDMQILLGSSLKQADVWVIGSKKLEKISERQARKRCFEVEGLGIYNYLLNEDSLENKKYSDTDFQVFGLNDHNARTVQGAFTAKNNIFGSTFYGGNDFPEKVEFDSDGEPIWMPKEFSDLAEGEIGTDKLGVLRMDIDSLGSIFKDGFDDKKRTFSRYASLSRNLDWFFKGYLNTIWKSDPDFFRFTYIVYSGGDDLFIVGHWAALIKMAKRIKDDFKSYTADNPNLTLSGGIAIVNAKFPISKAAEMADDAEKLAKKHKYQDVEKDAFAMLGVPLKWDTELPLVKDLQETLTTLIKSGKLPRGILQRLMMYAEQAEGENKGIDPNKPHQSPFRWRWMIAYDFGRAKDRVKNDEELKAFFVELQKGALCNIWENQNIASDYTFIKLLATAARWSELLTK